MEGSQCSPGVFQTWLRRTCQTRPCAPSSLCGGRCALTHAVQGSVAGWPPEIWVLFSKRKGWRSSGPRQANQQVTLLLLRALSSLLIFFFPKQPRQPVIDNCLSHQARYLKYEVLGTIHGGNKGKTLRRQQQLNLEVLSWEGNLELPSWARMLVPSASRNTCSYFCLEH